jgi:hypothetical protein
VSARVVLDERGAPVDFHTEDRYADMPGGPVRMGGRATRLVSRQRNTHPRGQRMLWRLVEPIGGMPPCWRRLEQA